MDLIWTDRNNITIEKLKILFFFFLPFLVLMKIFISQAKKKEKKKPNCPNSRAVSHLL